jgi:hypothetical protein
MNRIGGGGVPGPAGPAGATGAPGTPGQTVGNALLDGGGVAHLTNLDLRVSAASYMINGTSYTSAQADLTLSAADGSNPRIDVIAVNSSGAAVVVAGTAAANPFEPVLDPGTQLKLTAVTVGTGVTTLTTANTIIFTEGGVESWTETASGAPISVNSASSPITGSVSCRATAGVAGNYFQFANGGTDFDTTTRSTLALTIKNDASWPSAKSLVWQWYDGTIARGTPVTVRNGTYGFSGSDITTEQQIVIPLQAFGVSGLPVDTLRATIAGGGGSLTFALDDIYMQAGVAQASATTGMVYRGDYSAAAQYVLNDVVTYAGATWIALITTLGNLPTVTTAWKQLSGFITQNSQSAAYTTVLGDAGKHIFHPAADTNARTFTIDSNANVAYPVGSVLTFINETPNNVTVAITSDTLTLAGTTTTGSRTLSQNGTATAIKVTSTKWIISGTGLT